MRKRLQTVGWALLLVVVICSFFHECLFRGFSLVPADLLQLMLPYGANITHVSVKNHYCNDALILDYPWGVFWQQTVKSGQLPLWNPYIIGGHPHLAESMPAVLSPFKLLYLVLSAERAFTIGIVLEFLLAGIFMFALLRELRRSPLASFIGGCAWALNSALLMWYWREPGLFCWAPLVLLLLERSMQRDSLGYALGAGVVLGIAFLCGNIQAAAQLGFLCTCYGAGLVVWRDPVSRQKRLPRVTVMLLTGALIASVQWLPTLELISREAYGSTQARGPRASLQNTLVQIPLLITFLFPGLTGSTESYDLLKLGGATRGDFAAYIGATPFILALMAAVGLHERRVRCLAGIIVAVVTILLFTPLVRYLYHRFFVVAVFAGAMLAAYGADMLIKSLPEKMRIIRRTWATTALLCGILTVGLLVGQLVIATKHAVLAATARRIIDSKSWTSTFEFKTEWFYDRVELFLNHYRFSNVAFWLPIVCLLAVAATWWMSVRKETTRSILRAVLVLATILDLLVMGRQIVPQVDLQRHSLHPTNPILRPLENDDSLYRICRTMTYSNYFCEPNWLMPYHVGDSSGNFSLAPESAHSLFGYASSTNGYNALLDLVNVKYVFADTAHSLAPDRFELLAEADGFRTYRNKRCLPRAFFVSQWQVVSDRAQLLGLMREKGFDPHKTVFLEQEPILTGAKDAVIPASVRIDEYTPLHVVVSVQCAQPGILVLADTWYPGWDARVDGLPAPLYRADWILRAVALTAGEHRVEFTYSPRSFRVGAGISLLTMMAALVFAVVFSRRRTSKVINLPSGP